MSWTQVLLVCGLLIALALGDCPYQDCECTGTVICCSDRDLKAVPPRLSDSSAVPRSLIFDYNEITTVPAGSLPGNLSEFSINYTPIETIDDTAFDESINTLQILRFYEARFTQIPKAFFHLKTLLHLFITDTDIVEWDDTAMAQLGPSMNILLFDMVGLTTWPTWMKSMTNLTELTLSGGSITSIPDDAFESLNDTLTVLDLHNNSLTTLPQSLARMTALTRLSLDNNLLIDVTNLPKLSSLQSLSLDNNRITDAKSLSSAVKVYADTLYDLDINYNRLTSIPELSFMSLIETLDLTYNHISYSYDGSVPSKIGELNMGHNLLRDLPSVITGLQLVTEIFLNSNNIISVRGVDIPLSVIELDLSYNQITQLTLSSFPVESSLQFLYVSNNPLTTIALNAFDNLGKLKELCFMNTKLTRLPLAINSLTGLDSLNVMENSNLVCTCQEKALRPKIMSMGPYSVTGFCGMTSVYDFFALLSTECS